MRRKRPVATLLLVLAVLATACGARLTEEQREFALRDGGTPAGRTSQAGGDPPVGGGGTDGGAEVAGDPGVEDSSPAGGAQQQDADPAAGGTADGGGAADDGNGAGDGGAGDGNGGNGGDGGAAATGSEQGPVDTRQAPEGGNGGATDVGVTEDEIVLANVSDVSGAVPGLFEPSQLAAQAYVEFFSASEGTLYGRELSYMPMDGQLSKGANRSASIEACNNAFAAVGSMSAFDAGAAPPIEECGIPDIRTSASEAPMQKVDNAYPISASDPDLVNLTSQRWVTEEFPEATKKAADLYIAGDVTEVSRGQLRQATTDELGWEWIYVQAIDIAETNYAPFAIEMRDRGVEYVTFTGAYQQAVRLAKAMQQQDFEPEVYYLGLNHYNPDFIELGGEAVEDTYLGISTVMVEEAGDNRELQLYSQFLQQVAPGETPTSFGMYAWSAAKLFVEIAKEVGPEPTRQQVLDELAGVEDWDGGGLHPPIDVGAQDPSPCMTMIQVQDAQFRRVHPSSGFDCEGPFANIG